MQGLAAAERQYDNANPHDPIVAEPWESMPLRQLSDADIESWIAAFAETGDIEDEFGRFDSHYGSVHHALASLWVRDREKLTDGIANSFWKWAKPSAYIANFGKSSS